MIFVDPTGDDSGPGTSERPFATLARARAAARPGSVITLRGGTYHLTETFTLSAADSGVVYQAYGYGTADQDDVVISGGRHITGWRKGDDGVHLAEVPGLATRQLYVSGRRAVRASIPLDQTLKRTETGYTIDTPTDWHGEVELVYRGVYPWSEARCQVARIGNGPDGTTLTMAQPAFAWATKLYRAIVPWESGESYGADSPTSAENSPAFVSEGTFALNGGVLHYMPLPGESLDHVVAPMLETLIHANDVRDVAFRGITFADATWLRPSSPEGFLHYHGNGYYDGGELVVYAFHDGQAEVTGPGGDSPSMPANVIFENASGVTLEGCRFTRLGATALAFHGEGADNVLRGSVIDDVSGGGIIVGGGTRVHVEENHIHHIGRDYSGSPAVLLTDTHGAVVAHNQVDNVPHAGIVIYEGRGTQVLHNLVHDTMQVLADGGGVYIAGPQGDSPANGALIRGNVIRDTITPYNFALYTDYGAAWVTVEGNVVHRADNPVILEVWPALENVEFTGNYWDADPGQAPAGVTLTANTVLTEEQFATDPAVAGIVAAAGRTSAN